jgi:sRNA-binding carbon storage regulator CsrA
MALILGTRLGDKFQIDDHLIKVTSIDSDTSLTVLRDDGRKFIIRADRAAEVLPDVYVSIGSETTTSQLRLAFTAPLRVRISRLPAA